MSHNLVRTAVLCFFIATALPFAVSYGNEPTNNRTVDERPPLVLENDELRVEFNRDTGALVRLLSKPASWEIQRRRELGRSFEMLVPVPGRRNNRILGERQRPPEIIYEEKKNQIRFTWANLTTEHAGELHIHFEGTVQLNEQGLNFTGKVFNHSEHVVETVSWPVLGELRRPDEIERMEMLHMSYMMMAKNPVYPMFKSNAGYWGTDYPRQFVNTSRSPFVVIDANGQQGLYMGYHDSSVQRMVTFMLGLKPGHARTDFLFQGIAPETDEIAGQPVRLELAAVRFAFVQGGEQAELAPIVIRPYAGSWHGGVDVYKAWRRDWYTPPKIPDWARQVHSWQQLHINSPEDDLRVRYRDLVQYGRDCAEHGVAALQLTGWTVGGQDRGNPSHDVEPRLGSREDLAWAVREIQRLGVKVVMFNKFTWADRSTEWFRRELVEHAAKDPFGDYYVHPGYQYQTAAQFAHLNNRRLVPMCAANPGWRQIAAREFEKSIALGADGILYDENQHHGAARYCYATTHGHRQPAYNFSGDIPLAKMFHRIIREQKSEFLLAGEGTFDLQLNEYGLSYVRIGRDHVPLQRYVCPDTQIMIAVFGYDDRHQVNQALMYRYILSYEPRNFKGRLQEFPLTLEYGKRVDALRRRYADLLWKAEFRHTQGATVTSGSESYGHYSVFVDRESGRRAIVVINPAEDEEVKVVCNLPNARSLVSVTPESPEPQRADGRMNVPALSAVVLMEHE